MDVLYREHERLFLSLRLQHLIKMVSFTNVRQLSKPLSAVLPNVRRKLLTCDLWLALCLVTCVTRESPAVSAPQTQLSKRV